MPTNAVGLTDVSACNIVEHMKCVYLTGSETLSDELAMDRQKRYG